MQMASAAEERPHEQTLVTANVSTQTPEAEPAQESKVQDTRNHASPQSPAGQLVAELFHACDSDGSGYMDADEGKRFLSLAGCEDTAELDYYWEDVLRTADSNHDGKISKEEFIVYILGDEELDGAGAFVDDARAVQLSAAIRALQGGETEPVRLDSDFATMADVIDTTAISESSPAQTELLALLHSTAALGTSCADAREPAKEPSSAPFAAASAAPETADRPPSEDADDDHAVDVQVARQDPAEPASTTEAGASHTSAEERRQMQTEMNELRRAHEEELKSTKAAYEAKLPALMAELHGVHDLTREMQRMLQQKVAAERAHTAARAQAAEQVAAATSQAADRATAAASQVRELEQKLAAMEAAHAVVVASTVALAAVPEAPPAPASVAVASQEEQATEVAVLRAKTPKRHPSKPYGRGGNHSRGGGASGGEPLGGMPDDETLAAAATAERRAKTPARPPLRAKTPDVPRAKTPADDSRMKVPADESVSSSRGAATRTPSRKQRPSRKKSGGGMCSAPPVCAGSPPPQTGGGGGGGGSGGGFDDGEVVVVPLASARRATTPAQLRAATPP